jgi:nucleoside-diphosphate-sugar epimerase
VQILRTQSKNTAESHLVIMFGLGMIGSAIRDALLGFEYLIIERIDFHWEDAEQRNSAFKTVEAVCQVYSPSLTRVSIVWSAGKAAFHSTEAEIAHEHIPFMEVVGFVASLKDSFPMTSLDFHYISSAGGLFEGQRVITNQSIPAPSRPYGRLKLKQEQVLRERFGEHEIAFYRPSSIYGPKAQKSQQGLINNLVSNGRNGRVTVLDSHVMALRDYVFSGDIGRFVAKRIRTECTEEERDSVYFLVSSRCSSIFEVVQKIERTLHLNLQFRYDESFGNSSNITFSGSVLPNGWTPSTLDVGLRQFMVSRNSC